MRTSGPIWMVVALATTLAGVPGLAQEKPAVELAQAGDGRAANLPRVRFAQVPGGATLSILPIADKLGLYRKHGIEVETVAIETTPAGLAAVVSGSVQFTFTGPNIVDAVVAGVPVTTIFSISNVPLAQVCALKAIASPRDLIGKTVALQNRGSGPDVSFRIWLQMQGLNESQLVLRNIEAGFPAVLAAALNGAADAFVLVPPRCAQAAPNGFAPIADLGAINVEFLSSAIATSRDYLARNRDIVKKFLAALVEARTLFERNDELALSTIRDLEKITDPALAQSMLAFFRSNLADPPLVSEKALLEAVKNSGNAKTRESGPAVVGTMYDNTPLAEVLRVMNAGGD